MAKKIPIQLTLNGEERAEFVESGTTLLKALREKFGDTSPKGGCHQGTCGSCAVLVDGELRLSCLTLAETCEGANVETTAGLAAGGVLHPLQRAFLEGFAVQCGFCTPGMIMAAVDMIRRYPQGLDEKTVREELEGNICRCTGYQNIVKAILAASASMRGDAARAA